VTIVTIFKAISITYSECVFVAFVIQHVNCVCLITCLPWPVWLYLSSTLFHEQHDFRKKKIIVIKTLFLYPLHVLSETFLILKRNQPDIIIYVYGSLCKSKQYSFQIVINLSG
jgi:hypothetical protein